MTPTYPKPASVLDTQDRLLKASARLRALREKVKRCEEAVERLTEAHREQIARSLQSPNPEERQMAEGIAAWHGVPLKSEA